MKRLHTVLSGKLIARMVKNLYTMHFGWAALLVVRLVYCLHLVFTSHLQSLIYNYTFCEDQVLLKAEEPEHHSF